MKARRLSFWIGKKDLWIIDRIAQMQRFVEKEYGVSISQGEIIRDVLKKTLCYVKASGNTDKEE